MFSFQFLLLSSYHPRTLCIIFVPVSLYILLRRRRPSFSSGTTTTYLSVGTSDMGAALYLIRSHCYTSRDGLSHLASEWECPWVAEQVTVTHHVRTKWVGEWRRKWFESGLLKYWLNEGRSDRVTELLSGLQKVLLSGLTGGVTECRSLGRRAQPTGSVFSDWN
jgi:hypothetical protein